MRIALRTAVAAFALAGTAAASVVSATAATAATTTPAASAAANCVASTTVPSVYGGFTVKLVNSADHGASATLLDGKGAVVAKVDQSKPVDSVVGLKIIGALSAKPVFQQNNQGGDNPWTSNAFPALTAACTQRGTLVRTERLDAHTTARIYKVTATHYQARVFQDSKLVAFINAGEWSGAAVIGGRTLVLTPDGTTTTWTGAATTAAPRLGRYKLVNGAVVKLVRKNGVYGAQLTTGHGTFPVVYAPARPIVLQDDVTVVVLTRAGVISNHVYGKTSQVPVYLGA